MTFNGDHSRNRQTKADIHLLLVGSAFLYGHLIHHIDFQRTQKKKRFN